MGVYSRYNNELYYFFEPSTGDLIKFTIENYSKSTRELRTEKQRSTLEQRVGSCEQL